MLRKLYYALPPKWRLWVRRLVYLPTDILRQRDRSIPPKGMIYTGSGDFKAQGEQWLNWFKTLTYLQPNSKVLDIGSGIGRIAIPLSGFLTTEGQYCGFDAVEQGVVWCQENIGKQHPNFDFKYINLFNDLYKSAGIEAASFVFPYHDNAFDMACAISVFTHLLPEETLNYLEQTYRVLAKDGYLVATFFLLNDESRRQMEQESTFNFRYYFGNYSLMDKQVKAANVAYNEDFLLEAIQKIGFTHSTTIRGYWCGNNKGNDNDFQDILVLRK